MIIISEFYEQPLYRKALDEKSSIYRGLKLSEDDAIRREVIRHIRTFNIEFDYFDKKYSKNFKKYFEQELNNLKSHESDGLVTINTNNVILSSLGEHFSHKLLIFLMYIMIKNFIKKNINQIH